VKHNTVFRYAFLGVLFGFLFPVISTIWNLYHLHLTLSWESMIKVQQNNPMQWMIDTAPLILGLFASLAGISRAKVEILNGDLAENLREKNKLVEELQLAKSGLAKEIDNRILMLQAVAHVARESAGIRDVDELLAQASHLISEYFGFYHVGIFLLEKDSEYAILRASNSEGGQRMLGRGHRLKVGQTGIVGYVAGTGRSRIALDVDDDRSYFSNPDLPDTRSETALPLRAGKSLIGVLDLQSTEPDAFGPEDVESLQILADQIALAIENARLLKESRRSLQELEFLYGQQIQRAWRDQPRTQPLAFQYRQSKVAPVSSEDIPRNGEATEEYVHRIPLKLRHQALGYVQLRRELDQGPWSPEEIRSIAKAADQIALSLENARLFDEARRVVQREQKINEMSDKIRGSIDLETVLQNTVRELGKALGNPKTFIQIGVETANGSEEAKS
jgi:GAF domain-containing protein